MTDYRNASAIADDQRFAEQMTAKTTTKCRLCGDRMTDAEIADCPARFCWSCKDRPEAKRVIAAARTAPPTAAPSAAIEAWRPQQPASPTRAFNAAERALIGNLQAQLPVTELLRILNLRLAADMPTAAPFTLEQLHAEIRTAQARTTSGGSWAGLRRLLGDARRSGALALITSTVVDDFAVCYQLSPAQVTHLKDVIAHAKEGGQ